MLSGFAVMACMGTDIRTWCLREKYHGNDNDNSHPSAPCFVADRLASVCTYSNTTSIPLQPPHTLDQSDAKVCPLLPSILLQHQSLPTNPASLAMHLDTFQIRNQFFESCERVTHHRRLGARLHRYTDSLVHYTIQTDNPCLNIQRPPI